MHQSVLKSVCCAHPRKCLNTKADLGNITGSGYFCIYAHAKRNFESKPSKNVCTVIKELSTLCMKK